ncbi:hypothetical protein AAC387_Pa11g1511 [Persea americana]
MRNERERGERSLRVAPLLHVLMESADATSDETIISTALAEPDIFLESDFLLCGTAAAGSCLLLMGPTGAAGWKRIEN